MSPLIVIKVTVVLALAWLALAIMRRRSAASRHALIVTVLLAALAIPLLEPALPAWEVLPRPTIAVVTSVAEPSVAIVADAVSAGSREDVPAPASATDNGSLLFTAWLIGAGALLLLLLTRIVAMEITARRAEPLIDTEWSALVAQISAALDVRTAVQLRLRGQGSMPAVWGMRRPVVLLPRECQSWSSDRRRDVLNHELAHVARHDLLFLLLAHLSCAVHWFNPLAWLLKRKLAAECEHACDDLALLQGVPAPRYADHLLLAARESRKHYSLAPVMAARSQLEGRIMSILEANKNRGAASLPMQITLAAAIALTLVPLSSLTWAQADDMWDGITVHEHAHSHSHSAQFANHLREQGIAIDDVDTLITGLAAADALTRAASAWALGNSDDPRVVDPLIQAGYDGNPVVRQWAVRSLAPWVTPAVATMLVDRAQDDEAEVRQWAVRTLARYDAAIKTQPLIVALDDSNSEVREWAARGLANTEEQRAVAALANRAGVESSAGVKEWLVRGLRGSETTSLDALLNALYSDSADVRQWAVRGLSGSRDARAVDALISMLRDENDEVREWSARALGVCGNSRAVAPLQALSQDPSAAVREWAGRALETIDCS